MFAKFIVVLLLVAIPAFSATAGDAPLVTAPSSPMEWRVAWAGVTLVVVHALMAYLKSNHFPIDIPKRWRAPLALVLAQASGGLQMIVMGAPWQTALLDALVAGLGAVGGHEAVVEGLRGGKDWFEKFHATTEDDEEESES